MVLKHFALKDLFAFLIMEKYKLYLSKAVKKVIEETKELVYVDYSYHYHRIKNQNRTLKAFVNFKINKLKVRFF